MLGPGAQERLGLFVEIGGYIDGEVNKEVTAAAAVQVLDSLVAQPMDGTVLTAGFYLENLLVAQRRYVDRCTEYGLSEAHVGLVVKVVTVSLKSWITQNSQVHEESPVSPTTKAGRPAIGETHGGSIFDTGGNVSAKGHALGTTALATTVDTGCFNP